MPGPHGWIILDKPYELGSTQAVAAVKRNLREAGLWGKSKRDRPKVGHGGTLDPLATGVLPIALGEATKLTGRLLDASNIYEFTIAFGTETDTLDAEGEVIERSDQRPTLADIEEVLPQFTGAIEQMPPAYSALKVDGQRAYDLARAGEKVELQARVVEIYSLAVCVEQSSSEVESDVERRSSISRQARFSNQTDLAEITLSAHVSKGTYIRSLARDIARAAGTVGHVTMLRRTKAGPFCADQAISLDKLNEIGKGAPLKDILQPLEAGLDDIPALDLSSDQAERLRAGQRLDAGVLGGRLRQGPILARGPDGVPVALVDVKGGELAVLRGFNL